MSKWDEIRGDLRDKYVQILASLTATFGCFVYAFAHVWPAPAVPKLLANQTDIVITRSEGSWITTFHLIGQIIAIPLTIYLTKKVGSKNVILMMSVPLITSWLLVVFAVDVLGLYAARLLVGIANSFLYTATPMYLGEITEPKLRGALTSFIVLFYCLGTTVTFYFGYVLAISTFAYVGIAFTVVHVLVFCMMPSSPVYLVADDRVLEAKATLQRLLNKPDVEEELAEIKASVAKKASANGSNGLDLFRTEVNRSALVIMVLAIAVQQCSGFTTVSLYLHLILLNADVNMPVEYSATLFGVVQFLTSFVATAMIDRLGRRPLFIVSCIGSAACLFALGAFFYARVAAGFEWIALVALFLYIFIARIGIGVIPYVLRSEIFDTNVKQYGICVSNVIFSINGLIVNKSFLFVTDHIGMYAIFGIFSAFAVLGAVLVYFIVPETKNKSLAEIQEMIVLKKMK